MNLSLLPLQAWPMIALYSWNTADSGVPMKLTSPANHSQSGTSAHTSRESALFVQVCQANSTAVWSSWWHFRYSKESVFLKMSLTEKSRTKRLGEDENSKKVVVKLFKPLNPALSGASPTSGLYSYMSQFPLSWVSTPFNRVLTNISY